MRNKTALLVSLNFPPSQIASVHRARHLAKHLPGWGWRPIVLTVDERFHKEPTDPTLALLVPSDIVVHRVKAIPLWMTSSFGLGDLAIRSIHHVANKLDQLIINTEPSVVFFTGWPFYHMLLAGRIKRHFGVPVVLDFQDPWVSAYGATRPKWSKQGLSHRLARAFEPYVLRNANYITSVSDAQNEEMAARYPWLDRSRMSAIPIGGDPEDFGALRTWPPENPQVSLDPKKINLSYVGAFLPRAAPVVRQLLRSLASLRKDQPVLAARIRMNFVGTSNQPNGRESFHVAPIAAQEGVGDLVVETPQRVPFLEALSLLANSQGLLLIGSDELHYTASKIYPALMSGRPYLSLFHKASSAHAILSAAEGGITFSFSDLNKLAGMESDLSNGLREIAANPEKFRTAKPSAWSEFSASAIAGRFSEIFDALLPIGEIDRSRGCRMAHNAF